jgi:hypothetical protein
MSYFSKALKIGGAAAALALMVSAPAAVAVPRDHTVTFYFADDTYTQHVGTRIDSCTGQVYSSGTVTPYSQEMISQPCKPDHPE